MLKSIALALVLIVSVLIAAGLAGIFMSQVPYVTP